MAAHYWNGSMDIFNKHGSHSGMSVYFINSFYCFVMTTVNIKCFHCLIGCLRCLTVAFLQSAGRWSGGRRGQCYTQLSALLSRSRSHGNISVEMCAHSPLIRMSQTPSPWYQQILVKIVKSVPQQRSNQMMISLKGCQIRFFMQQIFLKFGHYKIPIQYLCLYFLSPFILKGGQ